MWNMGNKYNSPMSQMERLRKAGLNPNLVYGSGAPVGASAQTLPKYNAPTVDYNYIPPVDIPSTIAMFQDFAMKSANIRNASLKGEGMGVANEIRLHDLEIAPEMSHLKLMAQKGKMFKDGTYMLSTADPIEIGEYMKYQRESFIEQQRRYGLENQKIVEATNNLHLQNEYFAAKAISGLFGGAVGSLGKLGSMFFKGTRQGAKGALGTGTLTGPRPPVPPVGKGFTPNEWYRRWGYGSRE